MRRLSSNCLTKADGTSTNGTQLDANQWVSASFHYYCADTNGAGTFKLQASNDVAPTDYASFTATNWVDIPNQSASITSGAASILTISNCTYRWIRAVWTRSGGSAAVNVNVFALSM